MFSPDDWVRVVLDVDARAARLLVNGELRHSWAGHFAALRARISVGLPQAGVLSLRDFNVIAGS
jgi:hypothetical protein